MVGTDSSRPVGLSGADQDAIMQMNEITWEDNEPCTQATVPTTFYTIFAAKRRSTITTSRHTPSNLACL